MTVLPPLPDPLFLPEDPPAAAPEDVLVAGAMPAPAVAPAPAEPAPTAAPQAAPAPAFTLPGEDAFPTLAELDAILAAHAGPPAAPDAAGRAAAAELLGLDPGIADDPALYDEIVAALPDPDADRFLADWISEAEAGAPPSEGAEPAGDWQLG